MRHCGAQRGQGLSQGHKVRTRQGCVYIRVVLVLELEERALLEQGALLEAFLEPALGLSAPQ